MKRFALIALSVGAILGMGFSASAQQASRPSQNPNVVQICTGGKDGNYSKVGHMLQEQMKQMGIQSQVVYTQGSVQNLNLLTRNSGDASGWCDVAIAQNDAIRNFFADNGGAKQMISRMEPLYTEKVHFLCNREYVGKAGISRVPDIRGKKDLTVSVGTAGSGNNETWKSLVAADPEYNKVSKVFLKNDEALEAISAGDEAQCMVYTAGFKTGFIQNAIKNYGKTVVLLGFNDKDLDNAKDERGRPIYSMVEIPGSDYRGIAPRGLTCLGSCSVSTVKVDAVLVFRRGWKDSAGDDAYRALVSAKNNIKATVKKEFDPD